MDVIQVKADALARFAGVSKAVTWSAIAIFLALMLVLGKAAQAQERWQQVAIPQYPNATEYRVETDDDEFEAKFRSQDDVKAVFEFYRSHLESKGYEVTRSKDKRNGFEVDMARKGGAKDEVELQVKTDNGRFEVEIEFDD